MSRDEESTYADVWDEYVLERFPKIRQRPHKRRTLEPWRVLNTTDDAYRWPGDEWGDDETTTLLFDELLSLEKSPEALCELGAGSGRYTAKALARYPTCRLHTFDVSAAFDRVLRDRFHTEVAEGRLIPTLLDEDPSLLEKTITQRGLSGRVDAVFSFDAMVHVDLHTLFMYWLSAAAVLRRGGRLAMNVADATSDRGFMKLAFDAPGVFEKRGRAGGHFSWLCPELVESVLDRLGFDVRFTPGNGRDLYFIATLIDPGRGRELLGAAGSTYYEK